jgi:protein involved in polysaccharide export with SLBB domain
MPNRRRPIRAAALVAFAFALDASVAFAQFTMGGLPPGAAAAAAASAAEGSNGARGSNGGAPEVPVSSTPSIRSNGARPDFVNGPAAPVPPVAPVAPAVLAPLPKTEFQDFVEKSIGRPLPVFGANLFADTSGGFAPAQDIPVTADYVIGAGDELVIRGWGAIDVDVRATVDRTGAISIPRIGTFQVAGVRYAELVPHLHRQVSRVFKNFELSATLGQIRSIRVYVVGQARRPGSYTVSALSTLVNAVIAAGGPGAGGSLRHIELRRGGRVVTQFDFYDLLLRGDKANDARLASEDVIWIGPVGQQVAVHGSVNQPAIFESKRGATLGDAIAWAGGFAATAAGQRLTLERIENREHRRVEEIAVDAQSLARPLANGDLVNVYAIQRRFDNAVTLRGNVARPMRWAWRSGMRVSDLIPDRRALITDDFYLGREQIVLARVNEKDTNADQLRAEIKRSIREPNWEYAVVERLRERDLTPELIPFNLQRAVGDRDPQHDLVLQPGDVVTIFSRDDIALPRDKQTKFVRLEGEVVAPGVYRALPGETLRQIIVRIGGLAPSAYLYGSEFSRESVRREQEVKYEEAIRRLEQDMARSSASQGAVSGEDAQMRKEQLAAQQRLVEKMRGVKPTGRVALPLESPAVTLKDIPDLPLQDGDRFFVPARPESISVFGSVFNEGAFVYEENRRVGDYLALAGGPTRSADRRSLFVLRANGSVQSSRQSSWLGSVEGKDALPGDTVFVPEDFERQPFMKSLRDWTQIIYQLGLGAAAIKVLKN